MTPQTEMTPQQRQVAITQITQSWNKLIEVSNDAKPKSSVPFSFTYNGSDYELEGWSAGCGCTKVELNGNTISGHVDVDELAKLQKAYPGRTKQQISRNVTAYFKDGQPTQRFNPQTKRLEANQLKLQLQLQIVMNVDWTPEPAVTDNAPV